MQGEEEGRVWALGILVPSGLSSGGEEGGCSGQRGSDRPHPQSLLLVLPRFWSCVTHEPRGCFLCSGSFPSPQG